MSKYFGVFQEILIIVLVSSGMFFSFLSLADINSAPMTIDTEADDIDAGTCSSNSSMCYTSDPAGGASGIIVPGGFLAPEPTGNTVIVNSDIGNLSVTGGAVISGATEVHGNNVIIDATGVVGTGGSSSSPGTGSVYGGVSSGTGNVHGNTVTMNGGTVNRDVVGGASSATSGVEIYGNIVTVKNGEVFGTVYGGSGNDGIGGNSSYVSRGNTVTIGVKGQSGDIEIHKSVFGGAAERGQASGNIVNVYYGTIGDFIVGGLLDEADGATEVNSENTVTLEGTDISAVHVIGGLVTDVAASGIITMDQNKVTITGGDADRSGITISGDVIGSFIHYDSAGTSTVTITNTTVSVKNATGARGVYGAWSKYGNTITTGSVILDNVETDEVIGVYLDGAGSGAAISGYAVTISNSVIDGDVYVTKADGTGHIISNNTLTLSNTSVAGDVRGVIDNPSAVNASSADNNITFAAGTNDVRGDVATIGAVKFQSDSTTVGGEVIANSVEVVKGINEIGDITASDGDVDISGGNNTLAAISAAGGSVIAGGDSSNDISGLISSDIGVSFADSSVNTIKANVTATAGNISFSDTSRNTVTADATFSAAAGSLDIDSTLILANQTATPITLTVTPSSSGVVNIGQTAVLDLGVNNFLVTSGDLNLASGATLNFAADGSNQGSITVSASGGNINADAGRVYIGLAGVNEFDSSTPLFDMSGGGSIIAPDTEFYNLLREIVPVSGGLGVGGYLDMSEEISDVADALEVPFSRNARNITNLLNAIRESGDIALYSDLASPFETIIQGLISGDSDLAATLLTALLKQSAGESVIGVTEAISLSTYKSQGVILGRLDKIHESATAVPPAAGYGDNSNRVWVGGFGSWAKQKSEDGIDGYDYDSGGVSIGYDRMVDSVPGLRFGVAGSFSTGDLKSSNGAAKVDIDTFSFGLYGSYLASNSVFFDATVSYGSSNNDSEVRLLNAAGVYGGVKKGSFDIDTFLAGARVGKIISFDNVNVTPSLGVRYLNFSQEGWRETITGTGGLGLANWFGKRSDSVVEIPLQVKINGTFEAGSATVTPELRLGWTLMAKKPDNELTIGFVGSDLSTTVFGTKARSNSFQVGAGVKIDVGDTVDIFANYDLDVAKKYTDHVASLGVGFNF